MREREKAPTSNASNTAYASATSTTALRPLLLLLQSAIAAAEFVAAAAAASAAAELEGKSILSLLLGLLRPIMMAQRC